MDGSPVKNEHWRDTNQPTMPSPHRARRCEIPGFGTENGLSATKTRRVVFVEPALYLLENGEQSLRHGNSGWLKMPWDTFFWGEINVFFFVFFEYERDWMCYINKSKSIFFGKCHEKNMFRIYVYNSEYLHMYLQCLIIPHMFCEVVCFKEITFPSLNTHFAVKHLKLVGWSSD